MAENLKIIKLVEKFISSKCVQKEEKKNFKIRYHYPFSEEKKFGLIYDDNHYISVIFNKKNQKIEELNKSNKDCDLNIKDYLLDLIFFKTEKEQKYIKFDIIIIINDFEIIKEEENKNENEIKENKEINEELSSTFDENKIIDINSDEKIIKKLKIFLYEYIKKNTSKNKEKNIIKKLFLENDKNNCKLFNNKRENFNININDLSEAIKIKEEKNLDEILDELNPEIKEELIANYIDEMPDDIVNLQKKYKKIKITKDMYKNFVDKKNNHEE